MKKFLLLMTIACSVCASAGAQFVIPPRAPRGGYYQPAPAPVRYYDQPGRWRFPGDRYFGLRLGLNLASVRSEANALDGSSLKSGLNVGIVGGWALSHRTPVFLETGLYYSQKGGKSNNVETVDGKTKFTYDLGYLEVPLVLKYRYRLPSNPSVSIEPFAGGFVGVGVAGNIKDYGNRQAFSSYDNGYFNRMDGGLKLGLGVGFGMGYVEACYDVGLANVGQDTFDDTRTGCLTFNVGVNF